MKRSIGIVIILLLYALSGMAEARPEALAFPAQAAATEAPPPFTGADAPYDGIWQPFEDGFRLYLPRDWAIQALTEAQREAGLFYRASGGDGEMGVTVGYMRALGIATVADLARDFQRAGFEGVTQVDLNGMPAIGFERHRENYRGVAFLHPLCPDYALYVYFAPLDARDADTARTGEALLASIGPMPVSPDGLKNN